MLKGFVIPTCSLSKGPNRIAVHDDAKTLEGRINEALGQLHTIEVYDVVETAEGPSIITAGKPHWVTENPIDPPDPV